MPDGSGLGTQNALLGGGRYDGLSEMLGGPRAPGIGFAIGEDRLILTLQAQQISQSAAVLDAYIAPLGAALAPEALRRARELRRAGLAVELGDPLFKTKKHFDTAERTGARAILFIGENELRDGTWSLKLLGTRTSAVQTFTTEADLIDALRDDRMAVSDG